MTTVEYMKLQHSCIHWQKWVHSKLKVAIVRVVQALKYKAFGVPLDQIFYY